MRRRELEANDKGYELRQGERYEIDGDGARAKIARLNRGSVVCLLWCKGTSREAKNVEKNPTGKSSDFTNGRCHASESGVRADGQGSAFQTPASRHKLSHPGSV